MIAAYPKMSIRESMVYVAPVGTRPPSESGPWVLLLTAEFPGSLADVEA